MATITANFETGTSGNTIATSDTGSATAWDGVIDGANTTVAYDTSHTYGQLSAKINTTASTPAYVAWLSTGFGTQTDHYGRIYVYFTANPSATFQLVRWLSAGSQVAALLLNTSGQIVIRDAANVTQHT